MKRPNLNTLLKKWQKRLRLQDWDITIKYLPKKDMPNEGDIGWSRLNCKYHYAYIYILEPKDNEAVGPHFKNVELTVVHELLHLHITPISKQDPEIEELAVECIAKGLLNL